MAEVDMTIGKLATAAGVGVETIRFYERKGLIKRPLKRDGGFRHYAATEIDRIKFIRRAQELGFTLREVKQLMELQSKRKITGGEVRVRAQEKIQSIKKKIFDLTQMEAALNRLCQVCGEGEKAIRECQIFDCFGKQGC